MASKNLPLILVICISIVFCIGQCNPEKENDEMTFLNSNKDAINESKDHIYSSKNLLQNYKDSLEKATDAKTLFEEEHIRNKLMNIRNFENTARDMNFQNVKPEHLFNTKNIDFVSEQRIGEIRRNNVKNAEYDMMKLITEKNFAKYIPPFANNVPNVMRFNPLQLQSMKKQQFFPNKNAISVNDAVINSAAQNSLSSNLENLELNKINNGDYGTIVRNQKLPLYNNKINDAYGSNNNKWLAKDNSDHVSMPFVRHSNEFCCRRCCASQCISPNDQTIKHIKVCTPVCNKREGNVALPAWFLEQISNSGPDCAPLSQQTNQAPLQPNLQSIYIPKSTLLPTLETHPCPFKELTICNDALQHSYLESSEQFPVAFLPKYKPQTNIGTNYFPQFALGHKMTPNKKNECPDNSKENVPLSLRPSTSFPYYLQHKPYPEPTCDENAPQESENTTPLLLHPVQFDFSIITPNISSSEAPTSSQPISSFTPSQSNITTPGENVSTQFASNPPTTLTINSSSSSISQTVSPLNASSTQRSNANSTNNSEQNSTSKKIPCPTLPSILIEPNFFQQKPLNISAFQKTVNNLLQLQLANSNTSEAAAPNQAANPEVIQQPNKANQTLKQNCIEKETNATINQMNKISLESNDPYAHLSQLQNPSNNVETATSNSLNILSFSSIPNISQFLNEFQPYDQKQSPNRLSLGNSLLEQKMNDIVPVGNLESKENKDYMVALVNILCCVPCKKAHFDENMQPKAPKTQEAQYNNFNNPTLYENPSIIKETHLLNKNQRYSDVLYKDYALKKNVEGRNPSKSENPLVALVLLHPEKVYPKDELMNGMYDPYNADFFSPVKDQLNIPGQYQKDEQSNSFLNGDADVYRKYFVKNRFNNDPEYDICLEKKLKFCQQDFGKRDICSIGSRKYYQDTYHKFLSLPQGHKEALFLQNPTLKYANYALNMQQNGYKERNNF